MGSLKKKGKTTSCFFFRTTTGLFRASVILLKMLVLVSTGRYTNTMLHQFSLVKLTRSYLKGAISEVDFVMMVFFLQQKLENVCQFFEEQK